MERNNWVPKLRIKIEDDLSDLKLAVLKKCENQMITIALARANGNRIHAAEILGIPVKTLHSRIRERRADDI